MQKINYTLRSDGRYMCRLYVGKDEKGKNKYITLYAKTQKELKTKYIEAVSKRDKGVDLSSQSTRLGRRISRTQKDERKP